VELHDTQVSFELPVVALDHARHCVVLTCELTKDREQWRLVVEEVLAQGCSAERKEGRKERRNW
jgi:hypothetical protein